MRRQYHSLQKSLKREIHGGSRGVQEIRKLTKGFSHVAMQRIYINICLGNETIFVNKYKYFHTQKNYLFKMLMIKKNLQTNSTYKTWNRTAQKSKSFGDYKTMYFSESKRCWTDFVGAIFLKKYLILQKKCKRFCRRKIKICSGVWKL